MLKKNCRYSKCGKEFTPAHGKQLYCSKNCKAYFFNENKKLKKVILYASEDHFIFIGPDGIKKKCTIVWDDENEIIKQPVRPVQEKNNQLYNFGDDKFLMIEKYTKYPLKDKPKNKFDSVTWLKEKADSDNEIKRAWALLKK